jgi:hypothetical protein
MIQTQDHLSAVLLTQIGHLFASHLSLALVPALDIELILKTLHGLTQRKALVIQFIVLSVYSFQ